MADLQQLAVICQGSDAWNAWKEKNPSVPVDLSEANLSGASLWRADLFGANLWRTNLGPATLMQADLSKAHLAQAPRRGGPLRGKPPRGTPLEGIPPRALALSNPVVYTQEQPQFTGRRIVVSVRDLFARTLGVARSSRLSTAEAILTDYYHDIMAPNVALRSLRELGYTEQQARRMLDRTRELRTEIPTR